MSSVWLCSDLHLYHKGISNQRSICNGNPSLNTVNLVYDWKMNVKKDDTVIVLGDVCFEIEGFEILKILTGKKILVKGNHDVFHLNMYTDIFSDIHGLLFKHGFIYSHCPVHSDYLRHNRINVHGHLHNDTVNKNQSWLEKHLGFKPKEDKRYFNVRQENLYKLGLGTKYGYLISLQELREHLINR